jgi:apolipoprotein N-acyltransferase
VVTPDGRESQRTQFFTPGYLDSQVRLKATLTPAARWGAIVQGTLVVAALAILFAAMLHNGWFADLNRRLSALGKRFGPGSDKSDDDPPGDDVIADGDEVSADAELDEDGRDSARQGPDKGDI